MFNPDFYPTPGHVIDTMIEGLELQGKTVLEPSAGSGNIVKALQTNGANVIACENHPDLLKILKTLCPVIEPDFFNVKREQVSHIDYIIMNPPFSNAAAHIEHAWNVAPDGCKIIALCNIETIKNPYSKSREALKALIKAYGQYVDLGDCFTQAERKTGVNVAMVRLDKPGSNYDQEFSGFFMDDEPEAETGPGLMSYNAVRDLVNRYVESVKIYDQQIETAIRLNGIQAGYFDTSDPEGSDGRYKGSSHIGEIAITLTQNGAPLARNEFKKRMQKSGWAWIFSKLNLEKYATRGLKEDINKFVEKQQDVPFTMANIYRMLDMIIQTTGQRMDRAVLEVFDKVTKHYDDNKYGLEGWKTNSHFLLTRKFILPGMTSVSLGGGWGITHYSQNYEIIDDLHKALCYLLGTEYDEIGSIWQMNHMKDEKGEKLYRAWNTWYTFGMFRMKAFKKGTMHIEFLSEDVWAKFNQHVAKLKGYPLAEKKEQTKYQQRQTGRKPVEPMAYNAKKKPVILSTIKIGG